MENLEMLNILNKIKTFLEDDSLDLAKDLIRLEIENLKDITPKKCQNTKYYYYDSYCHYCSNENCIKNQNKI